MLNQSDDSLYQNRFLTVAVLFLLPALPLVFLGYGSDNDIYGQLDAGALTWAEGSPTMSRHPGYWVHEGIVFILNRLGGSIFINVITLCVSLLTLYWFWLAVSRVEIQWRLPIVLCLAWNPWYLIASTSAVDYVWAILFIVLSIELFMYGRPFLSGLVGGFATGFRLASIFTIVGALAFSTFNKISVGQIGKLLIAAVTAAMFGLLFYIPSWIVAGKSFIFLQSHLGSGELWTLKMHLGRVFYKPIYLTGVIATVFVILIIFIRRRDLYILLNDRRDVVRTSIGAIVGTGLLYAKYPIEHSYLLPALPFVLIIIGLVLNGARPWMSWLLVASSVSFWFLSFPLAEPNVAGRASDASIGIGVEAGVLLADVKKRMYLMGCESVACYSSRMEAYTYPR